MKHTPPSEIDGVKVEALNDPTTIRGEVWVTLIPKGEDNDDDRIWEFSLTTGRLLEMDV